MKKYFAGYPGKRIRYRMENLVRHSGCVCAYTIQEDVPLLKVRIKDILDNM